MKARLSMLLGITVTLATTVGCVTSGKHNLPPSSRLMHPGPGVTGPGPGVMIPPPGAMTGMAMPGTNANSQILFAKPDGMQVRWMVSEDGSFDSVPLIVPGRHNFQQAGIYRLKLTNIPGREGAELYPTLEVGPATPRTEAFLAHNAIPIQFTEEDLDQVMTGNFVTKVIYLPDPEFQELALAGVETLVSTRLDPGLDPIVEADRRGAILGILRLGNKAVGLDGGQDASVGVVPATYGANAGGAPGAAVSIPGAGGTPPYHIAGMTTPQYGMPITGTPIGLPGPPHIPLGGPAGLQKHVMTNHTKMHIPGPTKHLKYSVEQRPGMSYPRPSNHVRIMEQAIHPSLPYHQPVGNQFQMVH